MICVMKHSVSLVDETNMTGYCSACEMRVPVYRRRRKNTKDWFQCKPSSQKQKAKRHLETYSPDIEKAKRLRLIFNITIPQWEALFESQGRKCAVCYSTDPIGKGWHVDHNHKCCSGRKSCGKCIRGILCSNCNTALGLLRDNKEILQNAINYLE